MRGTAVARPACVPRPVRRYRAPLARRCRMACARCTPSAQRQRHGTPGRGASIGCRLIRVQATRGLRHASSIPCANVRQGRRRRGRPRPRLRRYGIAEAAVGNFTALPRRSRRRAQLHRPDRDQAASAGAARRAANGSVFVGHPPGGARARIRRPAVNTEVTRGATYIVRNPLDVACFAGGAHGAGRVDQHHRGDGDRRLTASPTRTRVPEPLSSWSHARRKLDAADQAAVNVDALRGHRSASRCGPSVASCATPAFSPDDNGCFRRSRCPSLHRLRRQR